MKRKLTRDIKTIITTLCTAYTRLKKQRNQMFRQSLNKKH